MRFDMLLKFVKYTGYGNFIDYPLLKFIFFLYFSKHYKNTVNLFNLCIDNYYRLCIIKTTQLSIAESH